MRYAPGVPYPSTWVYFDSLEEAQEIARCTPNPVVVEPVPDDIDEYGTPPLPLDEQARARCSECLAVIRWRPDDQPGTPCASCCADHLECPPPEQGGHRAG